MSDSYLEMLTTAIESGHECTATHRESVSVHEEHEGQAIFDGQVEVFDVSGHPRASVAYAWGWDAAGGQIKCTAVIGEPPVECAADAVKAAIATRSFP